MHMDMDMNVDVYDQVLVDVDVDDYFMSFLIAMALVCWLQALTSPWKTSSPTIVRKRPRHLEISGVLTGRVVEGCRLPTTSSSLTLHHWRHKRTGMGGWLALRLLVLLLHLLLLVVLRLRVRRRLLRLLVLAGLCGKEKVCKVQQHILHERIVDQFRVWE